MSSHKFQKACVVGLGYIGLPTAATIASRGIETIGVDIQEHVIERLNAGEAHFSEPDLDILLKAAVTTGKLVGKLEPESADVFVIAVPTPFHDDKSADLSYVEAATRSLATVLKPGDLVILESTSPVGTAQKVCEWIHAERPELCIPKEHEQGDIHVAYCPERILPGRMVFELVENDRVIGGVSPSCGEKAANFYSIFVRGDLLQTKSGIAELVKLIENSYRDVNIAFANELSNLCEKLHLDVWEAIRLANRHPRVDILNPGPGVGGHCIAVDPWFLIAAEPNLTPLMRSARDVNDGKPYIIVEHTRKQIDRFKHPVVACLGLTYKPDIDDMRESPALQIVEMLSKENNTELLIVEPHINKLPKPLCDLSHIHKEELELAVEKADVILLLVAHSQFKNVERSIVLGKSVIDTVGLW